MAMKHYPAEFKADAVALYRSRPGATIKSVAEDLGVNTETLRNWIRADYGRRPGAHSPTRAAAPAQVPEPTEAELAAARKRIRELEEERDILRKAARYFAGGDALVNRFQFVDDHRRRYGVKRLCTILGIARSSFCYWRRTVPARAARQAADDQLARRIRAVHTASDGTYGVPRITAELQDGGERVNHKKVARVMRTIGLAGLRLRRKYRTTIPDPAAVKAADLIGRDSTAERPNIKYVGDITYLPVSGAKPLCLATVIDLCSRRLAGWAIADHMRAELVVDALAAAERTHGSLAGAIMYTDHGSQYTSAAFADACARAGVRRSMSAVGSSAGNAAAESWNASMKRETLKGAKAWPTARHARLSAFRWASRYNTRRRHSRLGQRSPIAYANAFFAPSTTLPQAA
ncbi:IS3 family transposase [Streptomyces abikoensis]|uniref:IS3 family transposase n=1 Tax=Streptomyces abikoensis TaxID=97398 RepID=A0ABW7TAA7_9ACTN